LLAPHHPRAHHPRTHTPQCPPAPGDHYKRRCRLVAPCCGELFWCRHCHNAAKDDGEQDPAKRHALDRKQVKEVECALCLTQQPVGETCGSCGVRFGRYSCLKCNFFGGC